jgi:transcriptional regulator with XRE-family HTH domain
MNRCASIIRDLLEERGHTQAHLARLAGVDPGTIAHLLQGGHCSTHTLELVADALGVEMADLFRHAEEPRSVAAARDRVVAAVVRELSDDLATALEQVQRDRKGRRPTRLKGERKLPFQE